MTTAERLKQVHPTLAAKALKVIELAKLEGHTLIVTQGLRTFAEQDALFRKRPVVTRARGGQSYHNYGLAVDFGFVKSDGSLDWTDSLYNKIGKWAAAVGLEWGGNWKRFKDRPHVQLPNTQPTDVYRKIFQLKGLQYVWNQFR